MVDLIAISFIGIRCAGGDEAGGLTPASSDARCLLVGTILAATAARTAVTVAGGLRGDLRRGNATHFGRFAEDLACLVDRLRAAIAHGGAVVRGFGDAGEISASAAEAWVALRPMPAKAASRMIVDFIVISIVTAAQCRFDG